MKASRTTMIGIAAAAMVLAALALAPASLAQNGEKAPDKAPMAGMGMMDKMSKMPMMAHMETMTKIKAALEQAKGAAEASGDKVAASKIDEALKLIEQDHQARHKHMAMMMGTCKKHMDEMKSMEQDMEKMKEEMGKSEQTKPMQQKMEEMKQKMQKMHAEMKSQAAEGEMKCPMCKKMMAGDPKVVNTVCPILGNKVDQYNVPDELTREFEGQKIGFCCAGCPAAWDKLTDAEKKAKLAAAMAKSEKPTTTEHEAHHGG